jgi:hypothetical protein
MTGAKKSDEPAKRRESARVEADTRYWPVSMSFRDVPPWGWLSTVRVAHTVETIFGVARLGSDGQQGHAGSTATRAIRARDQNIQRLRAFT